MPIALSPNQKAARDLGFLAQSTQSIPGVKSASAPDRQAYLGHYDKEFNKRAANIEANYAGIRAAVTSAK